MLDVCNGLCPPIVKDTPDCWIQLMKQCWNANPQYRPTAKQILSKVDDWLNTNELKDANEYRKQHPRPCSKKKHSSAIYYSRIIPHITKSTTAQLHNTCVSIAITMIMCLMKMNGKSL